MHGPFATGLEDRPPAEGTGFRVQLSAVNFRPTVEFGRGTRIPRPHLNAASRDAPYEPISSADYSTTKLACASKRAAERA